MRACKHGHALNGNQSRTYRAWQNMHSRCRPSYKWPEYYYDKGIAVCERWRTFTNFFADMGECPDGLTLDRIDGDKNYEPGNCRWATPTEQCTNKQRRKDAVVWNGKRVTEWAAEWGTTYRAAHKRITRGKHPCLNQ